MDTTQFFSGIRPNLINEKALKAINKILDNSAIPEPTTGEHLFKLYDEYIKPNIFGILIIVIISIYLFIRYIIKQYNENEAQIDTEIESEITDESENNKNKQKKQNKQQYKKIQQQISSSDDQFTLTSNHDEESSKEMRELGLEELNEEYNRAVRENDSQMSEQMLKDIYKKKKDKFSFDELTRLIVDGGNTNQNKY
jgi:hypothetical protein